MAMPIILPKVQVGHNGREGAPVLGDFYIHQALHKKRELAGYGVGNQILVWSYQANKLKEDQDIKQKNPAHGSHQPSWPLQIVALILWNPAFLTLSALVCNF